jgi:hypothetical protein
MQQHERTNLKHFAALIAAVAALLTAIGAFIHKPPEEDAKMAFDVLSKDMERLSAGTTQNHDDIVAMHNYLDGFIRARELGSTAVMVDAGIQPAAPVVHLKPIALSSPPPPVSPAPVIYKSITFAAVKAAKAD